jgi:hypothetical protein
MVSRRAPNITAHAKHIIKLPKNVVESIQESDVDLNHAKKIPVRAAKQIIFA